MSQANNRLAREAYGMVVGLKANGAREEPIVT
jgi:hypothetical protein